MIRSIYKVGLILVLGSLTLALTAQLSNAKSQSCISQCTQDKSRVSAPSQPVESNQKTEIALLQAICKATKGCILPASQK